MQQNTAYQILLSLLNYTRKKSYKHPFVIHRQVCFIETQLGSLAYSPVFATTFISTSYSYRLACLYKVLLCMENFYTQYVLIYSITFSSFIEDKYTLQKQPIFINF